MHQTQIALTDAQYARLRDESERTGRSLAELIRRRARRALRAALGLRAPAPARDRLRGLGRVRGNRCRVRRAGPVRHAAAPSSSFLSSARRHVDPWSTTCAALSGARAGKGSARVRRGRLGVVAHAHRALNRRAPRPTATHRRARAPLRPSHAGIDAVDYCVAACARLHDLELWRLNVRHFPMFPQAEGSLVMTAGRPR